MIGLIKSRVFRCVWEKNQYVGVALQPSYESAAKSAVQEEKRKRAHVSRLGLRAGVLQSPAGLSARCPAGLDKQPEEFRSMDRVGGCATSSPEVVPRKP